MEINQRVKQSIADKHSYIEDIPKGQKILTIPNIRFDSSTNLII